MNNYQGWLIIRDYDSGLSEKAGGKDKNLEAEVSEKILKFKESLGNYPNTYVKTLIQNGELSACFMGNNNHKSAIWEELVDLWKSVAKITSGSYGLLYFWDDEDDNWELRTHMQVYVLKRGALTLQRDPFLSPVYPEIEDPDHWD